MRPLRLLLSLSSCLIFIIILSIVAASKSRTVASTSNNNRFGAYFSWNTPSSLFPPSAIISLTDDNSTFFLARPAAFGPLLPARGLSGQIWIGAGFGDDNPGRGGIAGAEGELGCSDVPGWSDGEHRSTSDPLDAAAPEVAAKGKNPEGSNGQGSKSKRSMGSDNQLDRGAAVAQVDGTDDHLHNPPQLDTDAVSASTKLSLSRAKKANHADIQSLQETAEIAGKVVLLSRGGCGFLEKVKWVQRRGGVALIVGDDIRGGPLVTMYARGDTSNVTIPSIFTSHTTAHLLSKLVPSGGFLQDISAQDAARMGLGLPVIGTPASNRKRPQDTSGTIPTTSPVAIQQDHPNEDKSDSWLTSFFSSSSGKNERDSRRPPSSGKIAWILQEDFEDEALKKYNTKSASTIKSTQQTKAPSSDDFVIGVHDWRDPDLLESQVNAAQATSSQSAKSADHSSLTPHAGPKGGSNTPGSGEYYQSGKPISAAQNTEQSGGVSSGHGHKDGDDKTKSWMGRLWGSSDLKETDNGRKANAKSPHVVTQVKSKPDIKAEAIQNHGHDKEVHEGLWVTLTPASVSSSPFFDTLLVLVVSPLVTLTIVYALLLLRSRIRRRRWRAPKSVVDRLPVRTYQTIASSNSSNASDSNSNSPRAPNSATPLLNSSARPISQSRPRPRSRTASEVPASGSSFTNTPSVDQVQEKREAGLAEWRRRYGGRQRECVICLEEYVDGISRVMSLPCGHEFHADCITPWLTTRRRTCPICKGDVVRSIGRNNAAGSLSSPATQPLLGPSQDDAPGVDEVQEQAVSTRNYDPAANEPLADLEQGSIDPDRTR